MVYTRVSKTRPNRIRVRIPSQAPCPGGGTVDTLALGASAIKCVEVRILFGVPNRR